MIDAFIWWNALVNGEDDCSDTPQRLPPSEMSIVCQDISPIFHTHVSDILPLEEYFRLSIEIITLKNFLIGIFHGYIYGWVIALCGCYYGIYCGKDANSVGLATTKAVVASIVWIVITTGIITFFCEVWNI